MSESQDHIS
jgi:hypothetical protein